MKYSQYEDLLDTWVQKKNRFDQGNRAEPNNRVRLANDAGVVQDQKTELSADMLRHPSNVLLGNSKNNTYKLSEYPGFDVIVDTGGKDIIELDVKWTPYNILLARRGNDLIIYYAVYETAPFGDGQAISITRICNYFAYPAHQIETLKLAWGAEYSLQEFAYKTSSTEWTKLIDLINPISLYVISGVDAAASTNKGIKSTFLMEEDPEPQDKPNFYVKAIREIRLYEFWDDTKRKNGISTYSIYSRQRQNLVERQTFSNASSSSDTFKISANPGFKIIADKGGVQDIIELDAKLSADKVSLFRQGNSLMIGYLDASNTTLEDVKAAGETEILDYFVNSQRQIEMLRLASGQEYDLRGFAQKASDISKIDSNVGLSLDYLIAAHPEALLRQAMASMIQINVESSDASQPVVESLNKLQLTIANTL